MLITILAIVIALVAWSLHLMQQAVDRREFSLMLAGTLVAFSAAAMVGVYFLMGNYIGYLTGVSRYSSSQFMPIESTAWEFQINELDSGDAFPALQAFTPFEPQYFFHQRRAIGKSLLTRSPNLGNSLF